MCRLSRSRSKPKQWTNRPAAARRVRKLFPRPNMRAKPNPYAKRNSGYRIPRGQRSRFWLRFGKDESMDLIGPYKDLHLAAGVDPRANYRDYQRHRMLTLRDLLLENRIILLQGEIYDGNASEVVMKHLYLQIQNRRNGINFYLNSPGSSVTATMEIYDTMQILSCPVATYCVGLAASGGAVLLAGGSKGKRFALAHAKVMIHQPYGKVGGQVSDIEIQADEILRDRHRINEILARHTGQPLDRIARDTDRDFYMNANAAKEYHLVDEWLLKPKVEEET